LPAAAIGLYNKRPVVDFIEHDVLVVGAQGRAAAPAGLEAGYQRRRGGVVADSFSRLVCDRLIEL